MYERLSLQIRDEAMGSLGGRRVRVGNSGLVIWCHATIPEEGHMDFTPEGCTDPIPGMERQYALTFLGALDAAIEQHDIHPILPDTISVATNPRMAGFLQRNLVDAVMVVEPSPFQPLLEINTSALLASAEVRENLYHARNQLEAAGYYVDDPGM